MGSIDCHINNGKICIIGHVRNNTYADFVSAKQCPQGIEKIILCVGVSLFIPHYIPHKARALMRPLWSALVRNWAFYRATSDPTIAFFDLAAFLRQRSRQYRASVRRHIAIGSEHQRQTQSPCERRPQSLATRFLRLPALPVPKYR